MARTGIVGLGLIGGSIAAALHRRAPSVRVAAVDCDPKVRHAAAEAGVVDAVSEDVAVLDGCDLVFIATPAGVVEEWAARCLAALPGAIVTDTAGVKGPIVAALAGETRFVGGHPMAGREHAGFAARNACLFDFAPWFLVPGVGGVPQSLLTAIALLGARPVTMPAGQHDALMGLVSHMPHVLSAALGRAILPDGAARDAAGGGLRSMTRLAAGPASVHAAVLVQNREAVRAAIDVLRAELDVASAALDDEATLSAWLDDAQRLRHAWIPSDE